MIHWLLKRMEESRSAAFTEAELRRLDAEGFERLRRDGLIKRSAGWPSEPSAVAGHRVLTAVGDDDGVLELIDEEDIEFDPIAYDVRYLAWSLDIDEFARRMREVNGLTAHSGWLHERIYLLGQKSPDRAVLLGLIADESSGSTLLHSIPSFTKGYTRFLVACPTFAPSLATMRSLELVGVSTAVMMDPEGYSLPPWPIPPTEGDVALEHEDDYGWVSIRGRGFDLTEMQAVVVKILHEAWRRGRRSVSWSKISSQLPGPPGKMSDVFKGVTDWEALILRVGQSRYRLNL